MKQFSLKQLLLVLTLCCLCVAIGANLAENWDNVSWQFIWPANTPLRVSYYYIGFDGALLCLSIFFAAKCVLALRATTAKDRSSRR